MVQFDPVTGALVLPIWVSAALAALFLALIAIAIARAGAFRAIMSLIALAVVAYGGWVGSVLMDRLGKSEQIEARRQLEQRISDLSARTLAAGSPLSCLDVSAGDQVTLNCEKVVFASPENVSAAVSYVGARLALLTDGIDLASRSNDASIDGMLNPLRRSLESDRFGIVAYVLSQQPNCLPEQCEALMVLRDPNRVRSNLQDKTFDALVARYAASWTQVRSAVSDVGRGNGVATVFSPTGAPVSSKFDFPSANSIPPVSIMNSEPTGQGTTASAPPAAPAPQAQQPPAARRPPGIRAPVARANPPPQQDSPLPVPLAPSAAAAPLARPAQQ